MVILISHRGNIEGSIPEMENKPEYLLEAVNKGYHVELDVWKTGQEQISLGHDKPEYKTDISFLQSNKDKFICHAKTPETLQYLLKYDLHCFFHNTDDCVLTSKGFIWTYPSRELTTQSICVMPEWNEGGIEECKDIKCYGICSDFVFVLRQMLFPHSIS